MWRSRALHELSLLDGGTPPGGSIWKCSRVDSRPHLDGQLTEACWQQTLPQSLNVQNGVATRVWLAHDDLYLYLAATCPKRSATTYLAKRRPRPRDADLSQMDRIQLLFDVNRDYTSWWRFEIDHRGWTSDSLTGDSSWDPQYYVATNSDEGAWSVEMAIPLEELGLAAAQGQYWAVGIRRIVPKRFVEEWLPSESAGRSLDLLGLVRMD